MKREKVKVGVLAVLLALAMPAFAQKSCSDITNGGKWHIVKIDVHDLTTDRYVDDIACQDEFFRDPATEAELWLYFHRQEQLRFGNSEDIPRHVVMVVEIQQYPGKESIEHFRKRLRERNKVTKREWGDR